MKFLLVIAGIIFLVILVRWWDYYETMNYYRNSHCEKCGKYLVFEELQAPLMKEMSKAHAYTKTLTKYWKCTHCGYEDIRTEPQYIIHHKEGKLHQLEDGVCKECGKEYAIRNFRVTDVIVDDKIDLNKKIKYYKCRFCRSYVITIEEECLP